ncbi:MAG: leucine-rich repeat protein [Lachnospiraceae bacterium]|nr:leucine-rich repeat protein [Clostridia bacterium]MBQ6076277.1 leucine-rich repeat protein [Lachnospiraceae bacterium]
MKRSSIVIFLLIVGILMPAVCFGSAQAAESEILDWDENPIYVGAPYTTFRYNDRMLFDNIGTAEPSYELALASVALASAAYNARYQTKIESLLEDMHFSILYSSPYYEQQTTYENCDVVGFKIAEKYVRYGDKTYRIILLPVRGTPKSCEWYSDLRLGTGDDHYGFYQAASKVLSELKTQVNNPSRTADETILWTMGHSRGAAVANIIAGTVSKESYWRSRIPASHVFGYTFACPAVSKNADTSLTNIFNYNIPGDLIPALPLAVWNYKRFGQTLMLPESDFENVKIQYSRVLEKTYGAGLSTVDFESLLLDVAPTPEFFATDDKVNLATEVVAYLLGGHDDGSHTLLDIFAAHPCTMIEAGRSLIFPDATLVKLALHMDIAELQFMLDDDLQAYLKLDNDLAEAIENISSMRDNPPPESLRETDPQLYEIEMQKYRNWENAWFHQSYVEDMTGIKIQKLEDLYTALTAARSRYHDYNGIASVILHLLRLVADPDGNLLTWFEDAHDWKSYILWVNSWYFGHEGWRDNDLVTEVIWTRRPQNEYIGRYCFSDCDSLSAISIPAGAIVDDNAFWCCDNLTTLSFSGAGITIGKNAFCNTGLTGVAIPDSVITVGGYAFDECESLETISMPANAKYYPNNILWTGAPFYSAKNLTITKGLTGDYYSEEIASFVRWSLIETIEHLTIAEGVKSLASDMFYLSNGNKPYALSVVDLPASLKRVNTGAFNASQRHQTLTRVNYNGTVAAWCAMEFADINSNPMEGTTAAKLYIFGQEVKDLVIPPGVTAIKPYVFTACTGMTSVTIPKSVAAIGISAFQGCTGLQHVYYEGTEEEWNQIDIGRYNDALETAEIHFTDPLTITHQPESASAYVGAAARFTVAVSGAGLNYQWQYKYPGESWKNSGYASAKTDTLSFAAQEKYNKMQYRCKISDGKGKSVISSAAVLTIVPKITAQPKNFSAAAGDTAKFTVSATGAGLTYQWQYKYPDGSWTNSGYASGKTAALSFTAQAKYNDMQYRCKITDANGRKLTTSAASLKIVPKITVQPVNVSVAVGAAARFTVTAGDAGVKYQWQYKYPDGSWTNSGYSSAKTATLNFIAQEKYNKMQYRCKITGANGNSVTSSAVTLTIIPVIKTQPVNRSAAVGDTVKFTVTASGAGLTYQWQYKYPDGSWTNSGYSTAKTASLSFAAQAKYNKMQYRCRITDANGKTITSSAVTLTITPKITAQPKSTSAAAGTTARFSVTATGAGLTYQWQYKYPDGSWTNSGYSSAKTATLSVPVLAKYNGIKYRCIITDANGKKLTSSTATLTVR